MKLVKYKYTQPMLLKFSKWAMQHVELDHVNLLVGKNAVGKSRVLNIISAFAAMLTQDKPVYFGKWEFVFKTASGASINYIINKQLDALSEKMSIDGKVVISRSKNECKVFSVANDTFHYVSPPDNKLLLHVRRDTVEYPYLEELVGWAEGVHVFLFGHVHANFFLDQDKSNKSITSLEDSAVLLKKFDKSSIQKVIKDFNSLGYTISDLYTKEENETTVLFAIDKIIKADIRQNFMSQGMYRALSLIIFCHYLINSATASIIVIDDLCEGLDYERATKLGTLLFNLFLNSDKQLVVSSNDSFLMDVVDIKYWNVLDRDKNVVKVYNINNCKQAFEDFKYTGLSKFDFFSSDYLESVKCRK